MSQGSRAGYPLEIERNEDGRPCWPVEVCKGFVLLCLGYKFYVPLPLNGMQVVMYVPRIMYHVSWVGALKKMPHWGGIMLGINCSLLDVGISY
jgi:hypothetical protein